MFERFAANRAASHRPLLYAAVALTLGSAAIHAAVAPMHFQEYLPFGIFFAAAAAAQAALALALLAAPSRRLLAIAAGGTFCLIALWAVSRTLGLPIGPRPWRPETVGFADVVCVIMEVLATIWYARLALGRRRARPRRPVRTVLATAPWLLVGAALTFAGVSAAVGGMPVAYDSSPPVPGQPSTTVALLTEPPGSEPVKEFTLTARVARIGGQDAWTYNGTVPGPELRVTRGDRVRVTLVNHLPAATTIHWHGLRLPNADDGVAGITQQAVAPGRQFVYEFVAKDAGTYWYHSHQDAENQLNRGLLGTLVVEPSGGRVAEAHDYTVALHTQPNGGAVVFNGTPGDLRLAARPGETVRLRIVNAVAPGMDGSPEAPVVVGAPYRVVALDGHDIHEPQVLGPQRLALGMGQRADVVLTMPASGAVRLVDTEVQGNPGPVQLAIQRFFPTPALNATVTLGDGTAPGAKGLNALPAFDLTSYGTPAADAVAAAPADATYPLVLGSRAGFHDGRVELVHTLNGAASPNAAPITVREGQIVRLHIVNTTAEYHPIHLHGHIFSVLARNGVPIAGSPVHLDSILVGPSQTWDVAFLADNPGIWMLHCHVMIHASFGMTMTVNYANVSTSFEMGSRSGNVPE
jgi:FtsP/CotA-like multicopper oxidase with cupredoxin domain